MKRRLVTFVELIKLLWDFFVGRQRIDSRLERLTEDYSIVKSRYNEVMWSNDELLFDRTKHNAISRLQELLILLNNTRIEVLDLLSGSYPSEGRRHVNAILVELSEMQDEVEFLLLKQGISSSDVIEPPTHDGMIKYWRNMNKKHSVNYGLLSLLMG